MFNTDDTPHIEKQRKELDKSQDSAKLRLVSSMGRDPWEKRKRLTRSDRKTVMDSLDHSRVEGVVTLYIKAICISNIACYLNYHKI